MNIVFAGIIGRYPYGGVAWCSLMYLLGLRQLGHNVWYLEDSGECNYDPIENTLAMDPSYALRFIHETLSPYDLADRWCYIDYAGRYYGHTREQWLDVCRSADLFLDLSGGCWFWRDEYASIPHTAFIDSDPAFAQLDIAKGDGSLVEFFRRFGTRFTFGRNIGTPACEVPTEPLTWEHTWQPVCMEEWLPTGEPPRPEFTTVMTWKIKSFTEIGGNKDQEFLKLIHLPQVTKLPIELAIAGPRELLTEYGWRNRDAFEISSNIGDYRDYLRGSLGEFSVAKHTYVRTNSGWFSDRTECYMASGRPAVVQDTGFSAHVPTGEGLFAFRTAEEAIAGMEAILSDYERHSRAARDLAEEYFSVPAILPSLLERATSSRPSGAATDPGR